MWKIHVIRLLQPWSITRFSPRLCSGCLLSRSFGDYPLLSSMHPPSCSHHHIARFIFANAGQKVCMPHYRAHKPLISTPWCSPLSCFCQRQHFGLQWHNCQGCRRHLPYRVQQPSISEVATHVMLRSWWYVCISTTLQLMYVGLSEILVKNHEHDSTWPYL